MTRVIDGLRPCTWAWLVCVACAGCGAGQQPGPTVPAELDVPGYLLQFGAEARSTLRPPERSIDELNVARRRTPRRERNERRAIARSLAVAHMLAAEAADSRRRADRSRRRATRFARQAASGSRDASLKAEMDFVALFLAWRRGRPNADRLARRFIARRHAAGQLVYLAWLIRGEIAFGRSRWEEAATAYRYLRAQIEHPLYAFALYRTSHCWREMGRADDAREGLEEVRQLGCAREAPAAVLRVAAHAASELHTPLRLDSRGRTRATTCPPEPAP